MKTRVDRIFYEEMNGDTSFHEPKSALTSLFGKRYTNADMRKVWEMGIRHGIEIGLRRAGIDGQLIELNSNTLNSRHKEFIEKFFALSTEYECSVQFHPELGMTIVSRPANYKDGSR